MMYDQVPDTNYFNNAHSLYTYWYILEYQGMRTRSLIIVEIKISKTRTYRVRTRTIYVRV